MEIAPLLEVGPGVTALIGGGGKTTLLERLAEELRPLGRVILCTTTKIRRPEQYPVLTAETAEAVRRALEEYGAVCVGTDAPEGKLSAPALPFSLLAELADYVLTEADGSRGLPLKAHAPWEPVIPENAAQTILAVGLDGVGRPVGEACHRPERYAALAGAAEDAPVTPEMAARVIRAEGFGDRVYFNKAESAGAMADALALARLLDCPAVAGSLWERRYRVLR